MLDTGSTGLERSFGEASVVFAREAGHVALRRLRQVGSAKAILPRVHGPVPEVVFLNTSGGLTGGDRLSYAVEVGAGCHVVATTQTAERGYASVAGQASVDVRMTVGPAGRIDWLPQETILFNDAALCRTTVIDLAEGATGFLLETVILGRAAMGETVRRLDFHDRRTIRRGGRPVFVEPVVIDDAVLGAGRHPAILGDALALATLVLVAKGAEDAVAALRPLLTVPGVAGAVSGFDGKCVVRLMAADGWPLRRQVLALLQPLQRRAPPRVWQN